MLMNWNLLFHHADDIITSFLIFKIKNGITKLPRPQQCRNSVCMLISGSTWVGQHLWFGDWSKRPQFCRRYFKYIFFNKTCWFLFKFERIMLQGVQLTTRQRWFRFKEYLAPNHHPNQWWLGSLPHVWLTSPQRINSSPLDKMAAISQTPFSCAFSWMKSLAFWFEFHWILFILVQIDNKSALIQAMAGAEQATCH